MYFCVADLLISSVFFCKLPNHVQACEIWFGLSGRWLEEIVVDLIANFIKVDINVVSLGLNFMGLAWFVSEDAGTHK